MAIREPRQRRVVVLLTEAEYERLIELQQKHATATTVSEYVRTILLDAEKGA